MIMNLLPLSKMNKKKGMKKRKEKKFLNPLGRKLLRKCMKAVVRCLLMLMRMTDLRCPALKEEKRKSLRKRRNYFNGKLPSM